MEQVRNKLANRKERLVNRNNLNDPKEGAVLFPLLYAPDEEIHLLLVKRSNQMRNNPGDMAFPGGKLDLGETPIEGALREAEEEVGIKPNQVKILGTMDEYVSRNHTVVRAVVGAIEVNPSGNLREWAERVFAPKTEENLVTLVIPLSHFLNPQVYSSKKYIGSNNRVGYIRYFDISEYLPTEKVWGLTATIIRRFADLFFAHQLPEEPLTQGIQS